MFSFLRRRKPPSHQPAEVMVEFGFTVESGVNHKDIDVMAFGLNDRGVVSSDTDFVLYTAPVGINDALRLASPAVKPKDGIHERFVLDLKRIPEGVARIAFVATVYSNSTQSKAAKRYISSARIRLRAADSGAAMDDLVECAEIVRAGTEIGEDCVSLVELVRDREQGGKWKLRLLPALPEPGGLLRVLARYGVIDYPTDTSMRARTTQAPPVQDERRELPRMFNDGYSGMLPAIIVATTM